MCGVAGVLHHDGARPDPAVLAAMAVAVAHRGPDGQGVRVFDGCGLAHRRLSIIDLTDAGSQPMASADGRVHAVFNGEVYNFRELRTRLEGLGHAFRSSSDTEVILAGYLQWGEDVVRYLDGMFALALWDAGRRRLVLARDRTGKKPLYVYADERKVLFASEVKSILVHPGVDQRMNPEAVPQFLSHGYVPTPCTFWARIRKVRPSTYEVFDLEARSHRVEQYWEFPLRRTSPIGDVKEVEARLRALFFAAVKRRMVADVPLGAFLSGGIDSTLVVAAMAHFAGRVKTFSIGFEGYPEWDETRYARLVAERYGTEHTEFKVRPESFDLVDKLAWHYDEPFGDSSAIPTAIVAQLTRQKVTVALTGDGGDELFAGYMRFATVALAEHIPGVLRRLGRGVLGAVPVGRDERAMWERVRRLALRATLPLPERLRGWISLFPANQLAEILQPEYARSATPEVLGASYAELDSRATGLDPLNRVLFLNARTYLLDDLNVKMDRACMAASLEARAPFLDTALMEYAFMLPGALKLRGASFKWILKRAMADLLPYEVVHRRKMGFGVPLGAWFRGSLKEALNERLLAEGALVHEYVRREAIAKLLEEHHAGRRDLGLVFWSLWLLEVWLRGRHHAQDLASSN